MTLWYEILLNNKRWFLLVKAFDGNKVKYCFKYLFGLCFHICFLFSEKLIIPIYIALHIQST